MICDRYMIGVISGMFDMNAICCTQGTCYLIYGFFLGYLVYDI